MRTNVTFILVLLAILCIAFLIGMRDRRAAAKKLTQELVRSYGKPAKKTYPDGRYEQIPRCLARHPREYSLDDITWKDLDLDEIYRRMDSTLSCAGEEYLYYVLRTPVLRREDFHFEHRHYDFWDDHEDKRIDVQTALYSLGRNNKYSVYDYLDLLDGLARRSVLPDLAGIALLLLSLCLIGFSAPAGIVCLLASCSCNMITYFRTKAKIDPYLATFKYILRLLACADRLQKTDCPPFCGELQELGAISGSLRNFRRGSSLLLRGNAGINSSPLTFILDYICIVTHVDLIKFEDMRRQVQGHMDEIDRLILIIGKIDASIALASYRRSLGTCTAPSLDARCSHLQVRNMVHPLIQNPVPNDILIHKPVLMTGSNASGKSTFLKNIALCAVMAQTVRFVPASQYEAPFYRIYTSMALHDNLLGGESYFVVEIRSLKRILDQRSSSDHPVLCCIDEVLRGTNTTERISASTEILRYMALHGFTALAATHDIELTALLQKDYENYHFAETVVQGDVRFSYKLMRGPSDTRNAISLLASMGYEEEIVRAASEASANFTRTGKWESST